MPFGSPSFKNLGKRGYVSSNVRIHMNLSWLDARTQRAQLYIANRLLEESNKILPYDTGALYESSYVSHKGQRVTWPKPYARFVYNGIRKDGTPIHYSKPWARDHWIEAAWNDNKKSIIVGASNILRSKR